MTQSEKRLMWIALAIFAGYAVPFRLAPSMSDWYSHYQTQKKQQLVEVERLHRLSEQGDKWQQEQQRATTQQAAIETALLQGENQELVSARLKNLLRTLATKAQIALQSLELPEFTETQDWLMVTQGIQFEATSEQTMTLLQSIKDEVVALPVVSLDVRVISANRIQGTLKVTGFSKVVQGTAPQTTPPTQGG